MLIQILIIALVSGGADAAKAAQKSHNIHCRTILSFTEPTLKDLETMDFLTKRTPFSYVSNGAITAHELRSGDLLGQRLGQAIALIPSAMSVDIPAVDGIIFDKDGNPESNFSMKSIRKEDAKDINRTIKRAINAAEEAIEDRYTPERWREIHNVPLPEVNQNRWQMHLARLRLFGLKGNKQRRVAIVIDYSQIPTAVLRLHHTGLDGSQQTRTGISLNNSLESIVEVNGLIRKARENKIIKDYIFLGSHHLMRVSERGYYLDEFCDSLGHVRCVSEHLVVIKHR